LTCWGAAGTLSRIVKAVVQYASSAVGREDDAYPYIVVWEGFV
jgi:hypothetical protein